MHPAVKYGAATFGAVFFIGWVTGLGGSFSANLAFSAAMGAFAALCFVGAMKLSGRSDNSTDGEDG